MAHVGLDTELVVPELEVVAEIIELDVAIDHQALGETSKRDTRNPRCRSGAVPGSSLSRLAVTVRACRLTPRGGAMSKARASSLFHCVGRWPAVPGHDFQGNGLSSVAQVRK